MIELCQYEKKYLAICKHYQAIFDTPKVQETEEEWKEVCCVHVYAVKKIIISNKLC